MTESKIKRPVRKLTRLLADAKAARKPSEYEFALADSVELLNHQHWDELVATGSVMMSRSYLRVLRNSGPDGLMQRAGLLYKSGSPVAAFCTQTLDVNAAQLVSTTDELTDDCLLYTSPSPRDATLSRMPSSA